jgi:hypothetical protein
MKIKDLLTEATNDLSFGEFQKLLYAHALTFIKGRDAAKIKEMAKQAMSGTDRFWTSSFDDAYSSYERFMRDHSDDSYVDDVGLALDDIAENIYSYYMDPMNFAPGYQKPKLDRPEEATGDDADLALSKNAAFKKQLAASEVASKAAIAASLAQQKKNKAKVYRARTSKKGQAAMAPYLASIQDVVNQITAKGSTIDSIYVHLDCVDICSDPWPRDDSFTNISQAEFKAEKTFKGKFVDPKSIKIKTDSVFKSSVNSHWGLDPILFYEFDFKNEIDEELSNMLRIEVRKIK